MKKVENLETIFIATTSIDDQPKVEEELLEKLTQTKNWDGRLLHKYKGFWCPTRLVLPLVSIIKQVQLQSKEFFLSLKSVTFKNKIGSTFVSLKFITLYHLTKKFEFSF